MKQNRVSSGWISIVTMSWLGAVNAHQDVVLTPQRVTLRQFAQWAARHLRPTDQVAVEATTNTWALYDLIEPHVAKVVVAHPQQVRLIASAKVKHDKRDALILAHLLSANLLPEVWVPPPHVRQLRSLIVHRHHLTTQRRMAKNRLRGVLFRFNLPAPPGDVASLDHRAWWQTLVFKSPWNVCGSSTTWTPSTTWLAKSRM